jgi:eukaryotic-like serine/threonine-protein kinase
VNLRDDSLRGRLGQRSSTEPVSSLIPTRYDLGDRYALGDILGEGSMGRVYAARDTFLARDVALKVPRKHIDEPTVRSVLDEARAAARLESEHVARVLDAGRTGSQGLPYIVMERLEGVDLATLSATQMTLGKVLDYVAQACEAIAEAHTMGMVHRDIKPSNLFLATRRDGSSVLKVLDFGVADFGSVHPRARDNEMAGTPHYMAPEVLMGERATVRSDVWSLGVVLYELIAGEMPFDGDEALVVWTAILQKDAPRLDTPQSSPSSTHVPRKVADVVARCLAKDPAARYANAGELREALRLLMLPRARPPFLVALVCVVLVALGVVIGTNVHHAPAARAQLTAR